MNAVGEAGTKDPVNDTPNPLKINPAPSNSQSKAPAPGESGQKANMQQHQNTAPTPDPLKINPAPSNVAKKP
jgi:hypothetical protein